jgi:hypothetical protein
MDPGISSFNAFFTDVLASLADFNLVEVRAFFHLSSDQWLCHHNMDECA